MKKSDFCSDGAFGAVADSVHFCGAGRHGNSGTAAGWAGGDQRIGPADPLPPQMRLNQQGAYSAG